MAWRGLHISNPSRLSLKSGQMRVDQEDLSEPLSFPLEDIAWLILDTPQITLTAALLSACMTHDVPVICVDDKHLPCGMALPFHQHFAQAGVARTQLAASMPLKKRLWQTIVQCKISNQAAVIDRAQGSGGDTLRAMTRSVRSGDPDNVEARAARFYWGRLFADFRRHDDADARNAMLNYAYAILRAGVARGLVAAGLLPAFGLHHASVQNAFNLADDLLETLRPTADWMVFQRAGWNKSPDNNQLTKDDRQSLGGVLTESVILDGEQLTILPAIDRMVASLVRALSGDGVGAMRLPAL